MTASHTGLLFGLKSSMTRGHNVIYDCKSYWSFVRALFKYGLTASHTDAAVREEV